MARRRRRLRSPSGSVCGTSPPTRCRSGAAVAAEVGPISETTGGLSRMHGSCAASLAWPCRRLTRTCSMRRIRPPISRLSGATPPGACNTGITRSGTTCANCAKPAGWLGSRMHCPRFAATLLKSNVTTYGESITLRFRSKGAKIVTKEFTAPRLVRAIGLLRPLPGRRLFQYRAEDGTVRGVTAREVNAFLREIAGANISLKDFRTLLASASVLEMLARTKPAANERQRRKQVLEAVCAAAEDL